MEKYSVTDSSILSVQFDYSLDDSNSWHYKPSWEPDRSGFFKSPVYIRTDATKEIIDENILSLQFDEYLNIFSENAYTGDNDGWKDVNLYDFTQDSVYIKARFIYTIQDIDSAKFVTFISPWSDAVKVQERIIMDYDINPPVIEVLSTKEEILAEGKVRLKILADEDTLKTIMQLEHYDEKMKIEASMKTDGEFYSPVLSTNIYDLSGDYTFTLPDPIPERTEITARFYNEGNSLHKIKSFESGFGDFVVVELSEEPPVTPQTPTKPDKSEPTKPEEEKINYLPYIIPGFIAGMAVVFIVNKRKNPS